MEYAKLKPDNTFDYQISDYERIEWDESHFCSASALTPEEAVLFRVVPLVEVPMPPFDSKTQKCFRDGAEFVENEWRYKWAIVALTTEEISAKLQAIRMQSLVQINNDDNKIYADVIGNKTTEYLDAAIEAKAYKAAGYPSEVGDDDYELVKSWAKAKRWTLTQAANDILAQEAAWKGAAKLIRDYRLQAKEDVKRATTIDEIEAAMLIWINFVTNIRTQLGVN